MFCGIDQPTIKLDQWGRQAIKLGNIILLKKIYVKKFYIHFVFCTQIRSNQASLFVMEMKQILFLESYNFEQCHIKVILGHFLVILEPVLHDFHYST